MLEIKDEDDPPDRYAEPPQLHIPEGRGRRAAEFANTSSGASSKKCRSWVKTGLVQLSIHILPVRR